MSTVHIGEVATTIESLAGSGDESPNPRGGDNGPAFEVQMEELRPLVRALVAEELERWLRSRGDCP
jgi:hypothetical protein